MRKKTAKCISLFMSCCILSAAQTVYAYQDSPLQNRIVREFNQSNGLPTREANTVLQTEQGYVWIGSYGGLIRYDGTTFRNYSEEGEVASSSIRALFEDSMGRLWIGTNDMGVYLYENDTFSRSVNDNAGAFLSVRAFGEDNKGRVYAGTTSGLALVSENGIEAVEGVSSTVYSLQSDKNGVLWACMDNGAGKLVRDGGAFPDLSEYGRGNRRTLLLRHGHGTDNTGRRL